MVREIDDNARFLKNTAMKKNRRTKKMDGRKIYSGKKPTKKKGDEKNRTKLIGKPAPKETRQTKKTEALCFF